MHTEIVMEIIRRILANADIAELTLAPPPGHQHLRATITLHSGEEIILQEATVANLVRAYVGIKTHPDRKSCRLIGRKVTEAETKDGFASWQLLEEENEPGS
jgi:hypothetical protein